MINLILLILFLLVISIFLFTIIFVTFIMLNLYPDMSRKDFIYELKKRLKINGK